MLLDRRCTPLHSQQMLHGLCPRRARTQRGGHPPEPRGPSVAGALWGGMSLARVCAVPPALRICTCSFCQEGTSLQGNLLTLPGAITPAQSQLLLLCDPHVLEGLYHTGPLAALPFMVVLSTGQS